jgi:hypothetical protein
VSRPGVAACRGEEKVTSNVAMRSDIAFGIQNLESGITNLGIKNKDENNLESAKLFFILFSFEIKCSMDNIQFTIFNVQQRQALVI